MMGRSQLAAGVLVAITMAAVAGAQNTPAMGPAKPIWLAVTRPMFVEALAPLAEARRAEGFDAVVSTLAVEKAIASLPRKPSALLLVGDEQAGQADAAWRVPARECRLYRWRQEQRKTFASDAAWGDVDGDGVPEIPVGRLPCRTAEQVKLLVGKILAREARPVSLEDLALPVWAGAPGYGDAVDSVATGLLIQTVRGNAPAWVRPWLMSGDGASPLCGWPGRQAGLLNERVRGGSLMTCLMGHGSAEAFYSMPWRGRWLLYDAAAAQALRAGPPAGPMVVFACDSGDFTRQGPCLAESLLMLPGGPAATIAATTESHPLTNLYTGVCLLRGLRARQDRLGALWLGAQKAAMEMRDFVAEQLLRDVEGKLEERIDVAKLRRDQMLMYALLGDPAMRLRIPRPLEAAVRQEGAAWHWSVRKPADADALLVGFRAAPAAATRPQTPAITDEPAAMRAFEAANAAYDFVPLPSPKPGEPWRGTIDRPGTLRLVAMGKSRLYATTLSCRPPTTRPAASGQ